MRGHPRTRPARQLHRGAKLASPNKEKRLKCQETKHIEAKEKAKKRKNSATNKGERNNHMKEIKRQKETTKNAKEKGSNSRMKQSTEEQYYQ